MRLLTLKSFSVFVFLLGQCIDGPLGISVISNSL